MWNSLSLRTENPFHSYSSKIVVDTSLIDKGSCSSQFFCFWTASTNFLMIAWSSMSVIASISLFSSQVLRNPLKIFRSYMQSTFFLVFSFCYCSENTFTSSSLTTSNLAATIVLFRTTNWVHSTKKVGVVMSLADMSLARVTRKIHHLGSGCSGLQILQVF